MSKSRSKSSSASKTNVNQSKVNFSQSNITSFFNPKCSSSDLFSTFGSSIKNDQKLLKLSKKDAGESLSIPNSPKIPKATESNNITPSNKNQPSTVKDSIGQSVDSQLTEKNCLSSNKTAPVNDKTDDSDDDLIPPTPSPANCQRSFIRPTSLDHKANKKNTQSSFTNLKFRNIDSNIDTFAKKPVLQSSSFQKKNSSWTKVSEGSKNFSYPKNESRWMLQHDDNMDLLLKKTSPTAAGIINSTCISSPGSRLREPLTSSSKSLSKKAKDNFDLDPENSSESNDQITALINDNKLTLMPQLIIMKKSKAKSLKRSASKSILPSGKRHHGGTTLSEDINQQNKRCNFESHCDKDDKTMVSQYIAGLQSKPLWNTKYSETAIDGLERISGKPSISKQNATLESIPAKENKGIKTLAVGFPKASEFTESTSPNVSPQKTPIKEYDRHLLTDVSLVTPKKPSPNTSYDSLQGLQLDDLMDGLEWSPMPKKNAARSILFEEYTPHCTPYGRFLVLEVYRRDVHNDEAMSKYGRVLSEKVLRLFEESHSVERYCYLRQDWEMTEVEPGDVVHVTGEFDITSGTCVLDNQTDQYIVVHPDTLVSGTTIAGATRCLRRSILNERFRTEDTNEAMLMGTLLHELFDNAMQSKEFSTEYLNSQAKSLLEEHSYLDSLFSLGMTEVSAMEKITAISPEFSKWAKHYIHSTPEPDLGVMDYKTVSETSDSQEQPSVCIGELKDIEENVWSPRFGLKGKVDATVEVKIDRRPKICRHRPDKDNMIQSCVVPLELKTGKLFSKLGSVDHRAQVILYTLLLSDRHRLAVDSGLLYYMKSSHMVGVPALVHEKRALIMRRNEVARYLSLVRATGGRQMPGMLKDRHTCNRCSQANNCTLFHKSLENGNGLTSGLGEDFTKVTKHITADYARFFSDWFKLVCLEGKETQQSSKTSQHHIWSMEGVEREALGHCLSGLVLSSRDHQLDSNKMYDHKFERSRDSPVNTPFLEIPLSVGDRVVVSEEQSSAVALAAGYIRNICLWEVTVSLDRDLLKSYRSHSRTHQIPIYRLDKTDGYNSSITLWSNIARLLHNDSRSEELRQLIIDLRPPVFYRSRQALINFTRQSMKCNSQESQPKTSQASQEPKYHDTLTESHMESLNVDQKRAIIKVLSAEDYTLILGMPGTGKTTTIACLVQLLLARGKSVLLTSYTHTAVDNILIKLKQDSVDFLRLGQVHKMLPEIKPYSTQVAGSHIKTVSQLKDFYLSKSVVATTCLGVNHALFSQRSFDYCIVDEASQITLPVCLGPLHHASVFVLVGDLYQLPPLVQSLEAREAGMDISLFKRLSEHHPQAMVCLEHQYRMNQDIMTLSNTLIYENRLKCGTEQVATSSLCVPKWGRLVSFFIDNGHCTSTDENWLLKAIDPRQRVIFLNTDMVPGYESRIEGLVSNETEAVIVKQLTRALTLGGVEMSSLGIISPYRHQLKLIREALSQDLRDSPNTLEISTVDKYQGRDKDCILVSLVRSNEYSAVGDLLRDWRRVNVAVTRAKSKLILIGSLNTLKASLLLSELLDLVQKNGWIFDLPVGGHQIYKDVMTRNEYLV